MISSKMKSKLHKYLHPHCAHLTLYASCYTSLWTHLSLIKNPSHTRRIKVTYNCDITSLVFLWSHDLHLTYKPNINHFSNDHFSCTSETFTVVRTGCVSQVLLTHVSLLNKTMRIKDLNQIKIWCHPAWYLSKWQNFSDYLPFPTFNILCDGTQFTWPFFVSTAV